MASEDTPLLVSDGELAHEALYNRFSTSRKRVIVALVGCSAILPMPLTSFRFTHGSFIPCIPQVAADLNSTGQIVSFAVSVLTCGVALGSLLFATYSGFYGRRPIYLCGLPLHCLGSIGVGTAETIPQLMVFRFVQGFGTSGAIAVGGAVIGDIYKLSERGTAMGIFFAASLLGGAISPAVGGTLAWVKYKRPGFERKSAKYSSWRDVQLGLFFVSLFVFMGMLLLLPETSHPGTLGMDESEDSESTTVAERRSKWVWLNPFSCIWLLRSPNLLFVTIAGTTVLYTDSTLLVPIAYTLGARYNITNEAIIGACYFPMGLGNIVGALLAGMLSDRIVIKWRKRRGGDWIQEDRLRVALFGGATLVPPLHSSLWLHNALRTWFSGALAESLLLLYKRPRRVSGAQLVQCIPRGRGAFSEFANFGCQHRTAFSVAGDSRLGYSALHKPLRRARDEHGCGNYRLGWIHVCHLLLWLTVKYGDRMRAWVDVGYSTIETT
ncbi:MFS general substrate transporter [Mycena venus]|uniref:MFS general substrate transporter n=1 Tax=Mycena venus TaxID=2733690 RepID=A0A8H6X233_9AGAR|nr:MFS general substrate transporter [Mycena venus]